MKNAIYIGIILTLALFLFKAECVNNTQKGETIKVNGKKYEVVSTKIDTVYVKVSPNTVYKRGETIYKDTTIYQKVEIPNTMYDSIVTEYYAKKVFKDTIKFNSYGNIFITDTIYRNEIHGRSLKSNLEFPSITKTTIVKEKPKNALYIGAKSIVQNKSIRAIGTGLMFKTKRERMYGVGAMIDNQKNINFTLDFYIKL
mgnify:CR=1 FL=1